MDKFINKYYTFLVFLSSSTNKSGSMETHEILYEQELHTSVSTVLFRVLSYFVRVS